MELYTYKAEVIRVVDGDTVDFMVDLGLNQFRQIRVRLYGINAPEVRGDERQAGLASKAFLEEFIRDRDGLYIKTFKDKKGKYGRYLADIYVKAANTWHNVNTVMVSQGFAERSI